MERLPLRRRLLFGFVASMLVVLIAAGGLVYWRVQNALDAGLDARLDAAARSIAPQVSPAGAVAPDPDVLRSIDGYQVLDRRSRVLSHDLRGGARPLLDPALIAPALVRPMEYDTGDVLPIAPHPLRLYAVPLAGTHPPLVLVLSVSREQRDEALRDLLIQLVLAGLVALFLTALVGDRLARAALRPVETYRSEAARIASGATAVRLDVPTSRNDEVTRLGHTLNRMFDSLAESVARERRFVRDASHELRTPLTLAIARAQLMLRRQRSADELESGFAETLEDLSRLNRLADQLLDLGTEQQPHPETGGVDLADVATKSVLARTTLSPGGSPYAAAGALTVSAHAPARVRVDEVTLTRVLDNLLDNSVLHGRPPVKVEVDHPGDFARLTVSDAGPA